MCSPRVANDPWENIFLFLPGFRKTSLQISIEYDKNVVNNTYILNPNLLDSDSSYLSVIVISPTSEYIGRFVRKVNLISLTL
jgi:hypothetical protein